MGEGEEAHQVTDPAAFADFHTFVDDLLGWHLPLRLPLYIRLRYYSHGTPAFLAPLPIQRRGTRRQPLLWLDGFDYCLSSSSYT